MFDYNNPSFEKFALIIGKFILICGEIEFEITTTYAIISGNKLQKTWMEDAFFNKIKILMTALDCSGIKHKNYYNLLDKLSGYRQLRNHLSHGFVALDASSTSTSDYISIKIGTDNTVYTMTDLCQKITEVIDLRNKLNVACAEAIIEKNNGNLL